MSYRYDDNGNVTKVVESQGATILGTITSTYNGDNLLASRAFSDANGLELSATLTYDGNDNLSGITCCNSTGGVVGTSQYTYVDNMVTHIHDQDGSGRQLLDVLYSYDAAERLTLETDNGTTTNYSYDPTNQLINAGSTSYAYDANGNPTTGSYVIGTDNQILFDGTWSYTYDKQGNVIEKSQGIGRTTWIYQYDNANHLVDAQEWSQDPNVSGQPTLMSESQYVYDVFGNLLATTVSEGGSSTTTRFAYDLNHNIWAQLDGSGTVQTIYVRGDQQSQLLASLSVGDNVSWYLQDHLESVRGITNAAGALVQSINYDAYGNTTSTGTLAPSATQACNTTR